MATFKYLLKWSSLSMQINIDKHLAAFGFLQVNIIFIHFDAIFGIK